jgi:hypothetical protein
MVSDGSLGLMTEPLYKAPASLFPSMPGHFVSKFYAYRPGFLPNHQSLSLAACFPDYEPLSVCPSGRRLSTVLLTRGIFLRLPGLFLLLPRRKLLGVAWLLLLLPRRILACRIARLASGFVGWLLCGRASERYCQDNGSKTYDFHGSPPVDSEVNNASAALFHTLR